MKIDFIEIQNFRKLKSCRIEITPQESIFVGANNSGKTSAMDCMILFLKKSRRRDISTTDFTLSNWKNINKIGEEWIEGNNSNEPDFTVDKWLNYLPTIDIWLNVDEKDIHFISHLLPSLDWTPKQLLGVRLVYAPKKVENVYQEFREAYNDARRTEQAAPTHNNQNLSLWPYSLRNFLDKELTNQFEVMAFILDSSKCTNPEQGVANGYSGLN